MSKYLTIYNLSNIPSKIYNCELNKIMLIKKGESEYYDESQLEYFTESTSSFAIISNSRKFIAVRLIVLLIKAKKQKAFVFGMFRTEVANEFSF